VPSTRPVGDPGTDPLLAATNRFLASSDLDELGATILDAGRALLRPWKGLIAFLDPDRSPRIAAYWGYDDAELGLAREALEQSPLATRALRGEELWSDDPSADDIRQRLALYGARASFALPISTSRGVVGFLSAIYREPRSFSASVRDRARALVRQAGLAYELIGARDDLRRSADALERKTRATEALYQVSQELANVTVPDDVPGALARAIRVATGASYSLVGRWNEVAGRIEFVAAEGLTPDQRELLAALDARPERYRMIRGGLEGRSSVRLPPFDPDDLPIEVTDALGLTAIAGAPILVDDRPWGVVAVATTTGDASIAETGVELLSGLASIAASALGRTNAVAALERQTEVLESMVDERTLQLREAVEEALRASRSKSEFVASVSHELRTPMTAILGYSQLLVEGEARLVSPEQRADVEGIQRAGRQLLELIDDLLDVAAIEAGRIELAPAPIVVAPFVASVVESIRPLAGQKGVELSLTVEDSLPAQIVADPGRLSEVLVNLVGNAVKFTPTAGTVRIAAGLADDGGLRIEVADTGIGIAPEHHELVFDRFVRVAGPAYAGTGLGLPIARELARLHGGDVTLESTLGLGSRFTLRLPTRPPESAA
jgi:signal transduction histidine kinase